MKIVQETIQEKHMWIPTFSPSQHIGKIAALLIVIVLMSMTGCGAKSQTEETATPSLQPLTSEVLTNTSSTLQQSPTIDSDTQKTAAAFGTIETKRTNLQSTTLAIKQNTQTTLRATAEMEEIIANLIPVFRDTFDNNRNEWFTGVFSSTETVSVDDGTLQIVWDGKGSSYEVYIKSLENFMADIDCTIVEGGNQVGCGLVFAQSDDGIYEYEVYEDYYRLSIYPKGEDPRILVEGNATDIFLPNEANLLRVVRDNGVIRIYLNEQLLARSRDTTLGSGKIGISSKSYLEDDTAEIHFDNFALWGLP